MTEALNMTTVNDTTTELQPAEVEQTELQTTTVSEETVEPNTVDALMKTLLVEASELQNMYKQWYASVRKLSKEMDRERKKKLKFKVKRKVRQNPQQVKKEMIRFMTKYCKDEGVDHGTTGSPHPGYTRRLMMKTVSSYIKETNIQNPQNKKQWSGKDKKLKKLFSLDQQWYTFMNINGLLSRVIIKPKA